MDDTYLEKLQKKRLDWIEAYIKVFLTDMQLTIDQVELVETQAYRDSLIIVTYSLRKKHEQSLNS